MTELPWNKFSEDKKDLDFAESTLDKDHYGLQKIKERILEHLAVRNLKMSRSKKDEKIKRRDGGPPSTRSTLHAVGPHAGGARVRSGDARRDSRPRH